MLRIFSVGVLLGLLTNVSAHSHEYYLMPETFVTNQSEELAVRHRLGQKFKGNELPYIASWNIRSEVWEQGQMRRVKGLDGDRPALKIKPQSPGLLTVVHQSNIDFLTFQTFEKFQAYVTKEGLEHALEASEKGEKPKLKLKEAYSRFAKTLVSVGDTGEGQDSPVGLKIELVALAHPGTLGASQPMPVQVLFDGEPLAGTRIKVFVGVGTEFAHQINTDRDGKALIPADGAGPYLLNTIHMTEPDSDEAKDKNAHWESFWASLTFKRAQ